VKIVEVGLILLFLDSVVVIILHVLHVKSLDIVRVLHEVALVQEICVMDLVW
jgi:hypothetical protein